MFLVVSVHSSGRIGAVYQHRVAARCAANLRRLTRHQATGWGAYLVALPATVRPQVEAGRWRPDARSGDGYPYRPELLAPVAAHLRGAFHDAQRGAAAALTGTR